MARTPEKTATGDHFQAMDFGPAEVWREYVIQHPRRGAVQGKVFLRQFLGCTAMEVSMGQLAPGEGIPFLHSHQQNEELYLVLSGQGEMQVDGVRFPLCPGTAVRVDPAGVRGWRNTGSTPLCYLVVQAKAGSLQQATLGDGVVVAQAVGW